MKLATLILTLLCMLPLSNAKAEQVKPVVVYHGVSKWNGLPTHPEKTGWSAVMVGIDPVGSNTGVMGYIMHWDAKKKCWGVDRDCRNPEWAISQGVTYVGEITPTYFKAEIKQ